jgi:hypothetical protein
MESLQINRRLPFYNFKIIDLFIYGSALLGAQRILLPSIYAYACVATFIIALYYWRTNRAKFNALLVISLFLSVDNGSDTFTETPGFIRYIIYLTGIFSLVHGLKVGTKKLVYFFGILLIPLSLTVANIHNIDIVILTRDLTLVFLAGVVFVRSATARESFEIDFPLLINCLMLFLFVDVGHSLFLFSFFDHGYLSFDSTKSLIVLPALYYIQKGKPIHAIILLALTFAVLLPYGTRMIILSFLFSIVIFSIYKFLSFNKQGIFLLIFFFIGVIGLAVNLETVENFKIISSFSNAILEEGTIIEIIRVLDPVRFVELKILFDQNILNLLFGNGFGAGYYDALGDFKFIAKHDSAFSEGELISRVFYNFHDVWTDVGYRFGLLFLFVLALPLFRSVNSENGNKATLAMLLIVLINCAFFATPGLIIISIIGGAFLHEKNNTKMLGQ